MKSRSLGMDAVTKVQRMFHPSTDGDTWIEEGIQDVEPYVKENKDLYNQPRSGYGDIQRVAQIPIVVWEELMRAGIISKDGARVLDQKKFKAWLNDSENRFFRTRPGRV